MFRCKVKNQTPEEVNWNKSMMTASEFKMLHQGKDVSDVEMEGLFNLYDYSHTGTGIA